MLNDGGVWGDDPDGENDTIVLRSTDISIDGRWVIEDPAVRAVPWPEREAKRLEEGDLVVVKSSGSARHLGKTARVNKAVADERPCFANFVQRLRPSEHTDSRYLWYFLNSSAASDQIEMLGTTTTGLRNLDGGLLGSLRCPDVAVREQVRVADYLDAATARIDALVANKRRMIELLEKRRLAAMTAGVSGILTSASRVPAGLPWLPEVGVDWDDVKLTFVARLGSGHTPSRDHPEWWVDCTIPWVTTGEVAQMRADRIEFIDDTREDISTVGLANSAAELHPAGTVVLCRTAASAGYSAIMGADMATSQDFATWTCGPRLRPRFLLLCLRVMRQDLLGRLAMGSTHKTIYMPDIQSIRIPLPTVDEQDRIVEAVWSRLRLTDDAIRRSEEQLELLAEHRQALITAAVTGELDIPGFAA